MNCRNVQHADAGWQAGGIRNSLPTLCRFTPLVKRCELSHHFAVRFLGAGHQRRQLRGAAGPQPEPQDPQPRACAPASPCLTRGLGPSVLVTGQAGLAGPRPPGVGRVGGARGFGLGPLRERGPGAEAGRGSAAGPGAAHRLSWACFLRLLCPLTASLTVATFMGNHGMIPQVPNSKTK